MAEKSRKKTGELLSTGMENTMPGIANQSLLFLEPATAEPFKHVALGHYGQSAGPGIL